MVKELTCIICPRGCNIKIETENGEIKNITGNTCKRGEEYAKNEITNPVRTITTTIKLKDGSVLPVKTNKPIPKELIFNIMEEINKVSIDKNVQIGDVLIKNILNTGADVIATNTLLK